MVITVHFAVSRRRWLGSYHGHAGHDHPGPFLGAIWDDWAIYTHPKPQGSTYRTTLQPSHLSHNRPASSLVWTVNGAFYVP